MGSGPGDAALAARQVLINNGCTVPLAVMEEAVTAAAPHLATANLGLATTRELLLEIRARGETEHRQEYRRAASDMAIDADSILDCMPEDVLTYRTVDHA